MRVIGGLWLVSVLWAVPWTVTVQPSPMVHVPGGNFSERLRDVSRIPHRLERVAPFELDVHEVTVAQFRACVSAGSCLYEHAGMSTDEQGSLVPDPECNYRDGATNNHPMNCVTQEEAAAYCAAEGKRLPSDAEWLLAASTGDDRHIYPWGTRPPDEHLCWSGFYHREGTCPVGSFPASDSPLGVTDLAGNVSEWVTGPWPYVVGGSWRSRNAAQVSVAGATMRWHAERDPTVGFRCAR